MCYTETTTQVDMCFHSDRECVFVKAKAHSPFDILCESIKDLRGNKRSRVFFACGSVPEPHFF